MSFGLHDEKRLSMKIKLITLIIREVISGGDGFRNADFSDFPLNYED